MEHDAKTLWGKFAVLTEEMRRFLTKEDIDQYLELEHQRETVYDLIKALDKDDFRTSEEGKEMLARLKPIGTPEQPYAGTFDGQNHIISGLTFEKENDNVGLFGSLTAGACVRGITLDSSCTIRGANGVGLVGSVQGEGVVTLECLGNEGSVEASGKWAGGILGTCADDATSVLIRYCYASGSIQGGQESGLDALLLEVTGYHVC